MSATQTRSHSGIPSQHGACHHCGWNQPLQKVTRRQVALMRGNGNKVRPGARRICNECLTDLTSAPVVRERVELVATALGHADDREHLVPEYLTPQRSIA